jgi:hypothetical protein
LATFTFDPRHPGLTSFAGLESCGTPLPEKRPGPARHIALPAAEIFKNSRRSNVLLIPFSFYHFKKLTGYQDYFYHDCVSISTPEHKEQA